MWGKGQLISHGLHRPSIDSLKIFLRKLRSKHFSFNTSVCFPSSFIFIQKNIPHYVRLWGKPKCGRSEFTGILNSLTLIYLILNLFEDCIASLQNHYVKWLKAYFCLFEYYSLVIVSSLLFIIFDPQMDTRILGIIFLDYYTTICILQHYHIYH